MTDDPIDDGFHIPYPCWLLVRNDCVTTKDGLTRFIKDPVWLFLTGKSGENAMPVFTDDDTALRFCVSSNLLDEVTMIAGEDAQHLADILTLAARMQGVMELVFDPSKSTGESARVWLIDYAIGRIRKEADL